MQLCRMEEEEEANSLIRNKRDVILRKKKLLHEVRWIYYNRDKSPKESQRNGVS